MYNNIQQEQFTCDGSLVAALFIKSEGNFAGIYGAADDTGFASIVVKTPMEVENPKEFDVVLMYDTANGSEGIKSEVEAYRKLLVATSVN